MIDYSDFSVERFVMDRGFQEYVQNPTAENRSFWEKWLEEHPAKAEEIRQARLIILSIDFRKTAPDAIPKELLLNRIKNTILQVDGKEIQSNFSRRSFYYKIAAVFLGLLISTGSLYFLLHEPSKTYTSPYGEITHITLPDGSSVVLNANSSVRFERRWDDDEPREVWLQGEAFFNVKHKQNHQKFLVRTDQVDVEVLGTEFNVKNRRNVTNVVLSSGRIKLNRAGLTNADDLYMKPGELAEVSANDNTPIKKNVNPEDFSSWRMKQLIFKATALSEIAQTLEDNYGWESTFDDDAIKSYQFTGTVSTESTEEVELLLFTISEVFNIEILKEGNHIDFKKRK